MSDLLRVYKSLGDETRLRLLRLLSRGPLNVNEIMTVLGMGQSRISRHLAILADAGLLHRRKEGTWSYYECIHHDQATELTTDTLEGLHRHERSIPFFDADMQHFEAVIDRRRAQTQTYFDNIRHPQECLDHTGLDGEFYRQVAVNLLPERCGTALDIGTGSGLLIPHLLERAERVIAVDASTRMLELARETAANAAERCDFRCDFRLGDLEHLPVADGEVDAVVACMVLHHVSDPEAALHEAFRVLEDGGRVAIVDLHRHGEESFRERLADLWLGFQPAQLQRWLERTRFQLIDAAVIAPGSADEQIRDRRPQETASALKLITLRGLKPWQQPQPPKPNGARPETAELNKISR